MKNEIKKLVFFLLVTNVYCWCALARRSIKMRRVTFDPEPRPSSEASPPPLVLASYPATVCEKEVTHLHEQFSHKSILKNHVPDSQVYDSLCTMLIDLPPPPSTGLLSLDVLQEETVFKPKKAFFNLVSVDENPSDTTSLESDDDDAQEDKTSMDAAPYEDEEETSQIYHVQDSDIDELLFAIDSKVDDSMSPADLEYSEFPLDFIQDNEMAPIAKDEIHTTNIRKLDEDHNDLLNDFKIATKRNKVEDEPFEDNVVSLNETEPVGTMEKEEIKIDSKPIEPVIEEPCTKETYVEPMENTETAELKERSPDENVQNIEKDFEPVIEEPFIKETYVEPMENVDYAETGEISFKEETESTEHIFEPIIKEPSNEANIEETMVNTELQWDSSNLSNSAPIEREKSSIPENINDNVDIMLDKECIPNLDNDITDNQAEEKNYSIDLPNMNISLSVESIEIPVESTESRDKSTPEISQDPKPPQAVTENLTQPCVTTSSLNEPTKESPTNQQTIVSSEPTQTINAPLITNTEQETTHRHRRKSGRKHHRKHSHKQSSTAPPLPDASFIPSSIPKDPEQRALDAQAKFKRYLAKMAATAATENLNCAGEPETLEPHMVSETFVT